MFTALYMIVIIDMIYYISRLMEGNNESTKRRTFK